MHFRSLYVAVKRYIYSSDGAYLGEISEFQMASNTESLDLYSDTGGPWKNATVVDIYNIEG